MECANDWLCASDPVIMCECEYSDVKVIGYVRVEMCECEWRCASDVISPRLHLFFIPNPSQNSNGFCR